MLPSRLTFYDADTVKYTLNYTRPDDILCVRAHSLLQQMQKLLFGVKRQINRHSCSGAQYRPGTKRKRGNRSYPRLGLCACVLTADANAGGADGPGAQTGNLL